MGRHGRLVRNKGETSLECCAKAGTGEEVAAGAVEGVLEQLLRLLRLGYASVELVDLAFGKPAPASAAAHACGQQLTDLFEREPGVLPEANESNPLGGGGGVMP